MEPTHTHTVTLYLDIPVSLSEGARPEELVLPGDEYVRWIGGSLEGDPNSWDVLKSGSKNLARLTEPPKVTGVLVRDAEGTALVQSGSAIHGSPR